MRDTHWRSSPTGPGQPAPGVRGKTPGAPDSRPGGTSVPRLRRRPAAGPQAPQQYSRATGRCTPRGIRSPVPPATGGRRVDGTPRNVEQVRDHPGHGERPGAPGHGRAERRGPEQPARTRRCPWPRETSGPGAVLIETAMLSGPGEGRGRPRPPDAAGQTR